MSSFGINNNDSTDTSVTFQNMKKFNEIRERREKINIELQRQNLNVNKFKEFIDNLPPQIRLAYAAYQELEAAKDDLDKWNKINENNNHNETIELWPEVQELTDKVNALYKSRGMDPTTREERVQIFQQYFDAQMSTLSPQDKELFHRVLDIEKLFF